MDTQRDNRISEWLARAQQEPALAWREWSRCGSGVAILPLGRRFVAPRLPEALVYAAAGTLNMQGAAEYLAPLGPVIFDGRAMGGTYYPLMRWQDDMPPWEHQDIAPLLSHGAYLGVPRIGSRQPPGPYWAVPPHDVGHLCEPDAVGALVILACTAAREAEQ